MISYNIYLTLFTIKAQSKQNPPFLGWRVGFFISICRGRTITYPWWN